jgi:hypothetical protein
MAKRKQVLPARKRQRDRSRDDESLLMRSAETLGRMIGTLQRQLDGATKRRSKIEAAADAPVKRRRPSPKRKTAGKSTTGGTRKRAAARSAKKR